MNFNCKTESKMKKKKPQQANPNKKNQDQRRLNHKENKPNKNTVEC